MGLDKEVLARIWYKRGVRYFVKPFIVSLGSAAQAFAYYKDFSILRQHSTLSFLAWPFLSAVLYTIVRKVDHWLSVSYDVRSLSALVQALELEAHKSSTIALDAAKAALAQPALRCERVLAKVSQAKSRLGSSLNGVYDAFRAIAANGDKESSEIWVVLFLYRTVDGEPRFIYLATYPDKEPASHPDELSSRYSCVTRSVMSEEKKLVIVEDIEKELDKPDRIKHFALTSSGLNSGSIICYAIRKSASCPSQDDLAISVYSGQPNSFLKTHERAYRHVLDRFASRILTAYYFYLIEQRLRQQ